MIVEITGSLDIFRVKVFSVQGRLKSLVIIIISDRKESFEQPLLVQSLANLDRKFMRFYTRY